MRQIPTLVLVGLMAFGGLHAQDELKARQFSFPEVTEIQAVEIDNAFRAQIIQQGKYPTVEVRFTAAMEPYIDVRFDEATKTLHIGLKNVTDIPRDARWEAMIYVPDMAELYVLGASDVTVKQFKTSVLNVAVLGASNLTAEFTTADLVLEAGDASDVQCTLQSEMLKTVARGASDMKLSGRTKAAVFEVYGASEVDARKLTITDKAIVEVGGVSTLYLNGGQGLKVIGKLSGGSTLYYLGNPQLEALHILGRSRVRRIGQ